MIDDMDIRSVAYLRKLAQAGDFQMTTVCVAAAWAADEIERLRERLAVAMRFVDLPTTIMPMDEEQGSGTPSWVAARAVDSAWLHGLDLPQWIRDLAAEDEA